MDNPKWITYWRISSTSGGLNHGHLFALGLPPVSLPDYKTYQELVPQSQGGLTRQGYISDTLLWNEMDFFQLRTLTRIVEAAIIAGVIYATVPKDNGTKLLNSFVDVHGLPHPLTWQPVQNGRGVMYANVTLTINAIVVDADPSTVI